MENNINASKHYKAMMGFSFKKHYGNSSNGFALLKKEGIPSSPNFFVRNPFSVTKATGVTNSLSSTSRSVFTASLLLLITLFCFGRLPPLLFESDKNVGRK